MRKLLLVVIISFLLGTGLIYLVDTTWINESRRSNQNKLNSMRLRYSDALDVSSALVNNCYDAFYTISKCSTKEGCNFASTIRALTNLNLERKNLELELDQLLDGTGSLLLKGSTL